jgi:hypothetical protein
VANRLAFDVRQFLGGRVDFEFAIADGAFNDLTVEIGGDIQVGLAVGTGDKHGAGWG